MRAGPGLPSLRGTRVFVAVRSALAKGSGRTFRVLQFSVQTNHIHLIVEADAAAAFVRGCQGLAIRVAKAVNRVVGPHGGVWAERYHARLLATPRAVRNCLVYVLQNWRKHIPGVRGVDPRSSGLWFDGWRKIPLAHGPPVVADAQTWLARLGWRRHGRIGQNEGPRVGKRTVRR